VQGFYAVYTFQSDVRPWLIYNVKQTTMSRFESITIREVESSDLETFYKHQLLGVVFACLRISGRSIWPVAALHGAMNAFVHVNRLGIEIQPSLLRAAVLALAPVPLCVYGAMLLRKKVTHQPQNGANPAVT